MNKFFRLLPCLIIVTIISSACQNPERDTQPPITTQSLVETPTSEPLPTVAPQPTPTLSIPYFSGTLLPQPAQTITAENVTGLQEIAFWGEGNPNASTWSPDGSLFIVATTQGLRIYDAITLDFQRTISASSSIDCLEFSPDGTLLAVGGTQVQLWQFPEGRQLFELEGHRQKVRDLAFSPDGTLLATADDNGNLFIWNPQDGSLLRSLDLASIATSLAFSFDGKFLAVGTEDLYVNLWNTADWNTLGNLVGTYEQGGEHGVNLAFIPGTTQLAMDAYKWDFISIFDPVNQNQVGTLPQTGFGIDYLAFSPDGKTLAISGHGIRLVKVPDGSVIWSVDRGGNHLAYSPDGMKLSVVSGFSVMVLKVSDGTLIKNFEFSSTQVQMVVSTDGSLVASLDYFEEVISVRRMTDGVILHQIKLEESFSCLAISPDSSVLAAANNRGEIFLFNIPDGTLRSKFGLVGDGEHPGNEYVVNRLVFSPDGAVLAASGRVDVIRLWSVGDGLLLREIQLVSQTPPFDSYTTSMAISSDGLYIVTIVTDSAVQLLNFIDGSLVWEKALPCDTCVNGIQGVSEVGFSPDGQVVMVFYSNSEIHLLHASDGSPITVLPSEGWGSRNSPVFSPDGSLIAAYGNLIYIWNQATGDLLTSLKYSLIPHDLAFTSDGKYLIYNSDSIVILGIMP